MSEGYILDGDDIAQLMEMLEIEESLPMTIKRFNLDKAVDRDLEQIEQMYGESLTLGGLSRLLRKYLDKASLRADEMDVGVELE